MAWRRRSTGAAGYRNEGDRAAIGDTHVDAAIASLGMAQQKAMGIMTKYTHTREQTIAMLFPDEIVAKANAVRSIVDPGGNYESYEIGPVHLTINFTGCHTPTLMPSCLAPYPDRMQPLLEHINQMAAIHYAYEEVKGVLRWLNRNATPGAIRYYWPSALKLCKDAPVWKDLQEVPTRFTNPPDIGDWLQSLKDSAATVAGMLLLPNDAKPAPRETLWVQFPVTKRGAGNGYKTDSVTYNL